VGGGGQGIGPPLQPGWAGALPRVPKAVLLVIIALAFISPTVAATVVIVVVVIALGAIKLVQAGALVVVIVV